VALRITEMEETEMHRSKHISPHASRVSERGSASQKDPALIVYEEHPLNVGTPPACAPQTFLTPTERFFVRNHGSVPHVDVQHYRLAVTGMAQSPLNLSLDELRTMFPEAHGAPRHCWPMR
jgi:DMSO/TMAO reductase YedYZ molybdopterin-dependent catalytic subunit